MQKQDEAEKLPLRPQQAAQTSNKPHKNMAVSTADSEDGVAGKSKIHLKLDLDIDIRVIAG